MKPEMRNTFLENAKLATAPEKHERAPQGDQEKGGNTI
jgi:hypothetical protein